MFIKSKTMFFKMQKDVFQKKQKDVLQNAEKILPNAKKKNFQNAKDVLKMQNCVFQYKKKMFSKMKKN